MKEHRFYRDDRHVEALLIVCVVIWAANYPVAKYGIDGLDIFVFNSLRYLIAALLLSAAFLVRSRWVPIAPADRWKIFGAALLANVVYQMVFILGLSMTTAGNSAVLLSTSPLWTVLLNARFQKQRIPGTLWAGMLVSLAGVIMIIAGSGKKLELGSSALFGDIICLAAAALWGLNTNIQKPLLTRYSPMQLTLVMTLVGAAGLTAVALPGAAHLSWSGVHWSRYGAAIASGSFSIAVASIFWTEGIRRFSPGRVANFNNLVPVIAFLISYLVLDEEVYRIQVAGAAVTVAGVWLARRS